MDIKEINSTLAITDFLAQLGIMPEKQIGRAAKYISPIRTPESTPSFTVDIIKNEWYDHGEGRGGNLFDLAKELHPSKTNREVLQMLNRLTGQSALNISPEASALQLRITAAKQNPESKDNAIQVTGYTRLSTPALLDYVKERRINEDVAKRLMKQVYYQYKGKTYFAVGFQNDQGGFALRNKYVKLASMPNGVTFIDNGKTSLTVFEGFFSYASMETLRPYLRLPETNILVLNSLSFLKVNRPLMERHYKVFACLDNDEAGNTATALLKSWNNGKFWDARKYYASGKDLNAWLIENLDKLMLQRTKLSLTQLVRTNQGNQIGQNKSKDRGPYNRGNEF
ncbi:toprim domain-containing protein [Deminuibacter soli]|uniref:DNA primase n=1 Tax=Deminuibacter soli TaxID=2291815 RepID=A0A3E1NKT1_9BACT|nr:toprim domain-containing protein [Deminuibacter soli]RFM28549.1 hypothetical protein DXN05_07030 [Deminuibacter soli]